MYTVCACCLLGMMLAACAPRSSPPVPQPVEAQTLTHEGYGSLLFAVNHARRQGHDCGSAGRFGPAPALGWDRRLAQAAEAHALDMLNGRFFGHAGSDGSDPALRVARAGYDWRLVGENLAYSTPGYYSQESVVQAWLESPGHCANVMNPDFIHMGAVKIVGEFDVWTQVFATPR